MALDRRSVIRDLAIALEISPSELTSLPIPAPADGASDGFISSVRHVLMAVGADRPGGQAQPVEQLRRRATEIENGEYGRRSTERPGFIADLHTTIAVTRDVARLLPLAVTLHAVTGPATLAVLGASVDLRWQSCLLARRAAEELDDLGMLGVAAGGTAVTMLSDGAFDLARAELDSTPSVPTGTSEGLHINGMLALSRSLVAAAVKRPAETAAALEHAETLAARTGQGTAHDMGFGPVNVGLWRMAAALEADDPDTAIKAPSGCGPRRTPTSNGRPPTGWTTGGRSPECGAGTTRPGRCDAASGCSR